MSELSRRLTLPKSSVHLILRTFEHRGYLQKQPTGGRYRFGLKLMSLGHLALDGVEFEDEARPILQKLVRATGLTAHLGILERGEIVIIERVDAATPVISFVTKVPPSLPDTSELVRGWPPGAGPGIAAIRRDGVPVAGHQRVAPPQWQVLEALERPGSLVSPPSPPPPPARAVDGSPACTSSPSLLRPSSTPSRSSRTSRSAPGSWRFLLPGSCGISRGPAGTRRGLAGLVLAVGGAIGVVLIKTGGTLPYHGAW